MAHQIRLYSSLHLAIGEVIVLSKEQAHRLYVVMRKKRGDIIHLFNEEDGEFMGVIREIDKSQAIIRLQDKIERNLEERDIALWVSPIKSQYMQRMIEQATEMGVSAIHFMISEFTQQATVNLDKYQQYAQQAVEQSEQLVIPTIYPPTPLKSLIAIWDKAKPLIWCDETGKYAKSLTSIPHHNYGVIIGPEGGFSEEEKRYLSSQDMIYPISLGPRVLRVDTAVVAALSYLQSIRIL